MKILIHLLLLKGSIFLLSEYMTKVDNLYGLCRIVKRSKQIQDFPHPTREQVATNFFRMKSRNSFLKVTEEILNGTFAERVSLNKEKPNSQKMNNNP